MTQWGYGPMSALDRDNCVHTRRPDADDPAVEWCTRCGECLGVPSGGQCATTTELPFGHEITINQGENCHA